MTGNEIRAAAQAYVDELIEDEDAIRAINAGLAELGDLALIYSVTDIDAGAGKVWRDLPAGCTNVVEVYDAANKKTYGWRQRGNQIYLVASGVHHVHYRKLPDALTDLSLAPAVHLAFHEPLVLYVAGWWKLKDDDTNTDGLRLMEKFNAAVIQAFQFLRPKKRHKDFTTMTVADGGQQQ